MSGKEPIGPQPCPVLYTVSSPPRGVLDREKDQRNIDKAPTKAHNKRKKKRQGAGNRSTKQMRCEYAHARSAKRGYSLERVW